MGLLGKKKKDDEENNDHSWASHSDRFAIDQLLREKGFEIHLRPIKGEPIWFRRFLDVGNKPQGYFKDHQGEILRYTQSDALMECSMLEVDQANLEHEKYMMSLFN